MTKKEYNFSFKRETFFWATVEAESEEEARQKILEDNPEISIKCTGGEDKISDTLQFEWTE